MEKRVLVCFLKNVLEPLDQGFNIVKGDFNGELKKINFFSVKKIGCHSIISDHEPLR